MKRLWLFTVLFSLVCGSAACLGEDIDSLKTQIEQLAFQELPADNVKVLPEGAERAQKIVEATDKILNDVAVTDDDKKWALKRKAVAVIILAHSDYQTYYAPLLAVGSELEKNGLNKLANVCERHIVLVGAGIAIRHAVAINPGDKGINLKALAERMVLYAETNRGQESEQILDAFLNAIRMMNPIPRDRRLAVVAPIFRQHYLAINHTTRAAALQPEIDRSSLPGNPMAVLGVDIEGKVFDLNFIKDKVVLLQFWGTWCAPCRAEIPEIIRLYEKYHSQGFEVIGVNTAIKGDEDVSKVRRFLAEQESVGKKIPYTILHEGLSEKKWQLTMTKQYGINELPALILIGKNGKVISIHPLLSALDTQIAEALSPAALVEFSEEDKQKIKEAKEQRDAEEQKKIEEELKSE